MPERGAPIATLLRRLADVSAGEWRDFFRAKLHLAAAQLLVWTRPQGRLAERWSVTSDTTPSEAQRKRAREIGHAVRRAATRGIFHPNCLARSVAVSRFLRSEQLGAATIRIGVRLEHGAFTAHAWPEYGGEVVGDDPAHISRFDNLTTLHVSAGR